MVRIEIDGEQLVLDPKQSIRLKMRNPLMYDEVLPKYYTYPFTIRLDVGPNAKLLKYPQVWNNRRGFSRKIDCVVYILGESNPRKSVLNIRTVSETIAECDIIVDKNVDDLGDKNLRELDLGTFVLDNVTKKSMIIRPLFTGISLGESQNIIINGKKYSQPYYISANPLVEFANFLNANQTDVVASQLTYGGYNCLKLENAAAGAFTVTLDEGIALPIWIPMDETSWIQNHLIEVRNSIASTIGAYDPDTTPIVFPVVENIAYIDDERYNGFQNSNYVHASYDENKLAFITPMPHLCYVLKKLFELLGYDAIGDFMNDANVKRFILYSNVAADFMCKLYGGNHHYTTDGQNVIYPDARLINAHAYSIDIAKHCPDMTVKEFLTDLRKAFNLAYVYNPVNKTVEIFLADSKTDVSVLKAKDYTPELVNKWQLTNVDASTGVKKDIIRQFQFEKDDSDEKMKLFGPAEYQKPYVVNPDGNKDIEPKLSSIYEEKVGNFIMVPVVQIPGVYNNGGTVAKMKLLQYYNDPDNPSILELTIPDWAKIWYSVGTAIVPFAYNLDAYPFFSYTSDWSLRWDTDKGLYAKCWNKKAAAVNEGIQLKITMTLSATQLTELEKNTYMRLLQSVAIWKDIEIELRAHPLPPAEVTCLLL